MRDNGLEQALSAVGGVVALAKGLGVAQPSVSAWKRVPSDRVINIEALTGVSRHDLRPDLYPQNHVLDEIDVWRAENYRLIALLFGKASSQALLNHVSSLQGNSSPLGLSFIGLAEAAKHTTVETSGRAFFNLFIGLGRGEYLPYASYYLTGFLNERPLAKVREDMVRLNIERNDGLYEPEDHIAILCEIMAGLIEGQFKCEASEAEAFFKKHLQPWAMRFFVDVEVGQEGFYQASAAFARTFFEVEKQAFELK